MSEERKRPVAAVTGGVRRLGGAISRALAVAGYDLAIHYYESGPLVPELERDLEAAGARHVFVQGDLSRSTDVDRFFATTLETFGRVDALVANAGWFERTPLETLSEEQWQRVSERNLATAWLPARRFGLHMREHGGGAIVALADVAGLRPWRGYLAYNVAKAGVIAVVRTLAKELAPAVRVNAVAPGPVWFPPDFDPQQQQREIERTLLKRGGRPDHIADAVLFLLRNDYVTGVVLPVDGGRLYGS
jgi:NAD(P)-dependent dehydrogenase (short-subunit alcohol dehydrogenase family)